MVIQTCIWRSDTCDCVIEFQTDTDIPGSSSNFRRLATCTPHIILTGTEDEKVTAIRNENARGHGNVLQQILTSGPTTLFDIVDGVRQFKGGITVQVAWSGTAPNRVLNVTITGASLTTTQRNNIISAVNTRFGSGNVVLTFV